MNCTYCNEREVTHDVTGNKMCCQCHGQCEGLSGGECDGAIYSTNSDNLGGTKWCVYCGGIADFQWLDGGFYVCSECIKEGECDSQ